MLAQLREACQKISGAHPAPIEAAYVVVHAPLSTSRTLVSEARFERPTRIQDSTIAHIARETLSTEHVDRERLMEASVLRIELNGFLTSEPAGKWANRIRLVSLLSECDPAMKSAIEHELHSVFPAVALLWRSGVRALAAFARGGGELGGDYFAIDMGSESAQLISSRAGEVSTHAIPVGSTTILSKVAGGKPAPDALSALRMLASGAASNERIETLQKDMAAAEPDIVKALADGIGQVAAARRVSNTLVLLTRRDLESWLAQLLSRIDYSQFTLTTLPFEIRTPHARSGDEQTEGGLLVGLELVNSELSEDE
jgi:hypothetical protein